MKIIKYVKNRFIKTLVVLLLIGICVGCSSNNEEGDTPKSKAELMVGTWKAIKSVQLCTVGGEITGNDDPCDQLRRLQMNSDGTFTDTYYNIGANNVCLQDGMDTGYWKIVNDVLIINEDGFDEDIVISFFEISSDILKVGQYDDSLPCGTGDLSISYYFEFKRV